jgi:hypothetical protein
MIDALAMIHYIYFHLFAMQSYFDMINSPYRMLQVCSETQRSHPWLPNITISTYGLPTVEIWQQIIC